MRPFAILFVCHGNICRSPMAEFFFRELVRRRGWEERFLVQSAAVSAEETGNPVHPGTRRILEGMGIDCSQKRARQMTREDYRRFDLIIGMDEDNLRRMRRICGGDAEGKFHLLMEYASRPGEVADPWYTGDFEATRRDIAEGCQGLLASLAGQAEGFPL